jgi:hypothetical protein
MDAEFTYDGDRLTLDPDEWLRRWRVQMWAEWRLGEQIRARQSDPRAIVKITGV